MAFDEELANRVRELVQVEEGITEMQMFGVRLRLMRYTVASLDA
jgi:hypothetical protein